MKTFVKKSFSTSKTQGKCD